MIIYEQGFRKMSRKCRRGRRSNPVGHRGHRKARGESRTARLLKRELMLGALGFTDLYKNARDGETPGRVTRRFSPDGRTA